MKKLFTLLVSLCMLITLNCVSQGTPTEIVITANDIVKAGASIPASEIGEPVKSVILYPARWVEAGPATPAYGVVEGSIMPVDPQGWPINFRVLLPERWSNRSMQQGGGGMNGTITVHEGPHPMLGKGFALYGSDSGHQSAGMRFPGAPPVKHLATGPTTGDEWALNEEAIRNLGYMQMKKTHDAVMVILKRVYGAEPAFNYYVGHSHGGREALTVAQRYPRDYEGIISNVPIVNFSTLMLGPVLIRIQEIPKENWIPTSKAMAITREFLRQTDHLDGLQDGIISNYVAARQIFNVHGGIGPEDPWAALRASGDGGAQTGEQFSVGKDPRAGVQVSGNKDSQTGVQVSGKTDSQTVVQASGKVDPHGKDSSGSEKLTPGQIKTLELSYSSYKFTNPLANGVTSFGMWTPTTEPAGFGMITDTRYKGQDGAPENAPLYTNLGILGVTGFLMQDLTANPLDYVEGGKWEKRRQELSRWLDSTDPDLSEFYKHGGKIIMTMGAIDNIASSGAQMDYYQSLIDEMGQKKLNKFSRMYVVPNGNHMLSGRSYTENGNGEQIEVKSLAAPNAGQNMDLLIDWVENGRAPAQTLVIDRQGNIGLHSGVEGYLLCSYPNYQKYTGGPAGSASSYESAAPDLNRDLRKGKR